MSPQVAYGPWVGANPLLRHAYPWDVPSLDEALQSVKLKFLGVPKGIDVPALDPISRQLVLPPRLRDALDPSGGTRDGEMYAITGEMGCGKSRVLVWLMVSAFEEGLPIATNMELNGIPHVRLSMDALLSDPEKLFRQESLHHCFLGLDEADSLFSSRNFQSRGNKAWVEFQFEVRKRKIRAALVTHARMYLDKWIREQVPTWIKPEDLKAQGVQTLKFLPSETLPWLGHRPLAKWHFPRHLVDSYYLSAELPEHLRFGIARQSGATPLADWDKKLICSHPQPCVCFEGLD